MKQHIDVMIHHFLLASEGFTVPIGEVYQSIESARDELGFHVVSDGVSVHTEFTCAPVLHQPFGAALDG